VHPSLYFWARIFLNWGRRGFWWENQKERDHYEDLDMGGRIILVWILEK
jgi:hypothetical protein